jgi:hypothetical protein
VSDIPENLRDYLHGIALRPNVILTPAGVDGPDDEPCLRTLGPNQGQSFPGYIEGLPQKLNPDNEDILAIMDSEDGLLKKINLGDLGGGSIEGGSRADWTGTRFYAVDNVLGDDENLGYSDVDMLSAGAVAVKTPERLAEIIPPIGDPSHVLVIALKGRTGQYVGPDGSTIANFVKALYGYGNIVVRSTADFSNDATDERLLGSETVLGPYTVDTGATTSSIPVVGGGLPTDKSPYAYRIRFTSGALVGTTHYHWENNTSSVITPGTNTTVAATAGDTFVVEKPSVELGTFQVYISNSSANPGDFSVAGIECQTKLSLTGSGGTVRVAFINIVGSATTRIVGFRNLNCSKDYLSPSGSSRSPGTGMRVDSTGSVIFEQNDRVAVLSHSSFRGTGNFNLFANSITSATHGALYLDKTTKKIVCYGNGNAGSVATSAHDGILGNKGSSTTRPIRLGGTGSNHWQGSFGIWGLVLEDSQFVYWTGTQLGLIINNVTGTTSAPYPFNFEGLYGSTIRMGIEAANTAVGTGDPGVSVAGHNPLRWDDLTKTNVIDVNGNNFIGTGLNIVTTSVAVSNQSATNYEVGDIVRGNGVANQTTRAYATSLADAEFLGVAIAKSTNGSTALITNGPFAVCNFDSAPTPGAIAYLSTTPKMLTTTIPLNTGTNHVLPVGRVITVVSGTLAKVAIQASAVAAIPAFDARTSYSANWPMSKVRFYLIDPVAGDDTRIGYYDGDPLEVLNAATMTSLALKTYEEFYDRIPKQGNGRAVVVLIKGDQSITTTPIVAYKRDGITMDSINIDGFIGYSYMAIRCSNFTNDSNDVIDLCGYTPAALNGPNGDNSWTLGSYTAPTMTIAAGTMPVDTSFTGAKVQWKGNITSGLRTLGTSLQCVQTSTTAELASSTTTLPAPNDEFFLRKPSVRFAGIIGKAEGGASTVTGTRAPNPVQVCGFDIQLQTTNTSIDHAGSVGFIFVDISNVVSTTGVSLLFADGIVGLSGVYRREDKTTAATIRNVLTISANTPENTGSTLFFRNSSFAASAPGFIFAKSRLNVSGAIVSDSLPFFFYSSTIHGPLIIEGGQITSLGGSSSTNRLLARGGPLNSRPCVGIRYGATIGFNYIHCGPYGGWGIEVSTGDSDGNIIGPCTVTGMTNVTGTVPGGYGLSFIGSQIRGSYGATALIGSGNTVTGINADVRMCHFDLTWAQATAEERIDTQGNKIIPTVTGVTNRIQRVATGSWLRLPETITDPTEVPTTGMVDVWFNATTDIEQVSIRDSSNDVFRLPMMSTGAATRVPFYGNNSRLDSSPNLTFDGNYLDLISSPTVASAGGAVWDGMSVGGTLTLTGTTLTSALSLTALAAPTITAGSAVTVTDAATLNIAGAPVAAGSAVLTNSWALRVASGNTFLGGNLRFSGSGSAATALIQIANTANTGIYGSASTVNITAAGSNSFTVGQYSVHSHQFHQFANGTGASSPAITWITFGPDSRAGLFYETGGNLKISSSATTTGGTERGTLTDGVGNFVWGTGALTTSTADGYVYITSMPGTPTGSAANTAYTGRNPLVIDSTNNLLYFKNGGIWYAATGVSGTGVNTRVAHWTGTGSLGSTSTFTFASGTLSTPNISVTGVITGATLISSTNYSVTAYGTIGAPNITANADNQTGLSWLSAGVMALGTSNVERQRWDANGNVIIGTGALATNAANGYFYTPTVGGTPTVNPTSYSGRTPIIVDTVNDRLYYHNTTWKAVGNVSGTGVANRVAYWSSTSNLSNSANLLFDGTYLGIPDGSAANPGMYLVGATTTGIWRVAANSIGFSTNGVNRFAIYTNAVESSLPIWVANGLVGSPSYSFSNSTGTGMYLVSGDYLGLTTGGNIRLYSTNSNAGATLVFHAEGGIRVPLGSAGTPSIRNLTATNTGVFFPDSDMVGFSNNGVESGRFNNNGNLQLGSTASDITGYKLQVTGRSIFTMAQDLWSKMIMTENGSGGDVVVDILKFYVNDTYSTPTERHGGNIGVQMRYPEGIPEVAGLVITGNSRIRLVGTTYIDGDLYPYSDDTYDIGYSSGRWNDLYINSIDFGTPSKQANGTVAVTLTSLGPSGANTTVVEWLKITLDGNTRYIPCW